ncbi:MAG: hypothetical protein PHD56_00695 [Anaerostipes sp.]|nr:hypothetical protein [Anaerostipes sp.]
MRTLVKYECKRMMTSKEMIFSLMLGLGISFWYLGQYVWNQNIYQGNYFPETMFQKWIGGFVFPLQSFLYYLMLPFIGVLPGGATFYEDMESGLISNICLRCKKSKYLLAKYIAVFITSGVAFSVPLIVNLLFCVAHFPALVPEAFTNIGPSGNFLFFSLYFSNPWGYLILFLILGFLFAGGTACIALPVSFYVKHKAGVLLTPFILYFGVYCMDNIIGEGEFAPNYFLISGVGIENVWELIVPFTVFIIAFLVYIWKGLRYEG